MTITDYVTRRETCEKCGGTGVVVQEQSYCSVCYRRYTQDELNAMDDAIGRMPCGHAWRHLRDTDWCDECEGKGKITREVPLLDALAALGLIASETMQ